MAVNKTVGSSLIVAGTTIGAGMLAMPLEAAGIGFWGTIAILFILWFFVTYLALLFIELYQFTSPKLGIAGLAGEYFGKTGKLLVTFLMLIFLYAILCAYILGSSGIISGATGIDSKSAAIIFVIVLGGLIGFGTYIVDFINKFLFIAMVIAFVILAITFFEAINLENLLSLPIDNFLLLTAIPTFFTSFGFHAIMPSLVEYQQGNVKTLKHSIFIGTLIPLIIYIIWQASIHGVVTQEELKNVKTINDLASAINSSTETNILGYSIQIFSILALLTSFLGVGLATISTLKDIICSKTLNSLPKYISNTLLVVLAFAIPLILALQFQNLFLFMIGFAGVIFAIYAGVLPSILVLYSRSKNKYESGSYKVFGGKFLLVASLLASFSLLIFFLLPLIKKYLVIN